MLRETMKWPGGAVTPQARHRRYRLPCNTYLSKLDRLLADLRHAQARSAPQLADWLVYLDLDGKRKKTLYVYERVVATLLRAHPELAFEEFTHLHINEVLRQTPPRSRHIHRSIFSGWFQWGLEQEILQKNPMLKVPKMRGKKSVPPDIFTDTERDLLESLPVPDGPLWAILFGTGIRRGIARRLRRGNIDLDRRRLMVIDDKGGKDRTVLLPRVVVAAVADLDLLEPMGPEEYLWYRKMYKPGDPRRREYPIGSSTFERWYRRTSKAAGVVYRNPHQTRHTYGHWLRSEGWTLEERALLMGHEDTRTTQKYDRLSVDDLVDKMAAL
jgi:integrase